MTLKTYLYAGWGLLLVALLALGFTCGRGSVKCPPCAQKECPQIAAVTCTVTVRDTIRKYIPRERIIYRNVPAPTVEQCLSVEDTSNGAYARMTFCSRELPQERPADLRGTLELVLPPTTHSAIRYVQTDTLRVNVPAQRKWLALTVGPYFGYGTGGASVGVGVQLGLKIKER